VPSVEIVEKHEVKQRIGRGIHQQHQSRKRDRKKRRRTFLVRMRLRIREIDGRETVTRGDVWNSPWVLGVSPVHAARGGSKGGKVFSRQHSRKINEH